MEAPRYKRVLVYCSFLCLLLILLFAWQFYRILNKPLLDAQQPIKIIVIDKATSAAQFAALLHQQRLIKSPKILLSWIRAKKFANRLKAGVYAVMPGESVVQLINKVVNGDVLSLNFSIIAGTTQQKIIQDLARAPYLHYDTEDWAIIKGNYPSVEGLLLADTYQYDGGSDSKALLQHAKQNLLNYLTQVWQQRDPQVPYRSSYELLIAASIIEKETAIPEERKLISGVVANRLKKYMPLQMDPTVIYALGAAYKGKLSHQDMQINSPYNTYRNRGLPPTPIAMVGKEALDAAAHPLWSDYLYYVAKGDGSHQFSKNYEQQRRAIHQFYHKDH